MIEIMERSNNLTILDHHNSAKDTIQKLLREYPESCHRIV